MGEALERKQTRNQISKTTSNLYNQEIGFLLHATCFVIVCAYCQYVLEDIRSKIYP